MRKRFIKQTAVCALAGMMVCMSGCKSDSDSETTTVASTTEAEKKDELEFKSATYFKNRGLVVMVSKEFEGEASELFVIKDQDGNIVKPVSATVAAGTNITFKFDDSFSLMKQYTISFGDVTFDIKMPSVYSTDDFEAMYTYEGDDLGANYSKDATLFKVWAPTAESVIVRTYESGDESQSDKIEDYQMEKDEKGTWKYSAKGDLSGVYYTYVVKVDGTEREACDPYARTTGVNGKRAMVLDLDSTNPDGWDDDKNPNADLNMTDCIIYEMHMRDVSANENSGIVNKGKYLGLTETGTKTPNGEKTGLDYIKELGVNYVHILPMYDYGSVDETNLESGQFNWGYDPVNYNVPEGSYSTDPNKGEVRVKEAKQMVKTLHDNNISVIMDVVYNHVYNADSFCFNNIVPGYFSRKDEGGNYSNGSGCGNDNASERSMVSKYIVDSVKYWADEYHIDGFRFDLVGLIDMDTINTVVKEVHKTHPDIIFYGEGWDMKTTVTKDRVRLAIQKNATDMPGFGFFNDTYRDAIRGGNGGSGAGYATGDSSKYSQIQSLLQGKTSWTKDPCQVINYASCHDNNTLFDKITISNSNASLEEKIAKNKLTAAVTLTAQGTPFIMQGEEILRSKKNSDGSLNSNSYNSSDEVNSIDYSTLSDKAYMDSYNYYKGLIEFRKAHSGLRMTTREDIDANLKLVEDVPDKVVAFEIAGGANGEASNGLFIIYNGTDSEADVKLPEGTYDICVNEKLAGTKSLGTVKGKVKVAASSCVVLVKK